MDEQTKKRVDESWKEQAEREKQTAPPQNAGGPKIGPPEVGPPRPSREAGRGGQPTPGGPGRAEVREEPTADAEGLPHARFDLFVSGLAMETLIALGDMAHPVTRKQVVNLPQAKYLIDLLGVLEEKTKGNLVVEEEKLLKDALYQLRMRYLAKSGQ